MDVERRCRGGIQEKKGATAVSYGCLPTFRLASPV
jgi:hypothetical protein